MTAVHLSISSKRIMYIHNFLSKCLTIRNWGNFASVYFIERYRYVIIFTLNVPVFVHLYCENSEFKNKSLQLCTVPTFLEHNIPASNDVDDAQPSSHRRTRIQSLSKNNFDRACKSGTL